MYSQSLELLHAALRGIDCDLATRTLEKDVTSKIKTIAAIVNLNGLPIYKADNTNMTVSAAMRDLALNLSERVMTATVTATATATATATITATTTAAVVTIQRVEPINSRIQTGMIVGTTAAIMTIAAIGW